MSNQTEIVDARGLSCPQPVMLANRAMKKLGKGSIDVLVDSGTSRDNVLRWGKNAGWNATLEDQTDGSYRIRLKK
jgi:tRNA 2-thiouridine synthesizing protein A